jgi:hypothetical protein
MDNNNSNVILNATNATYYSIDLFDCPYNFLYKIYVFEPAGCIFVRKKIQSFCFLVIDVYTIYNYN